jgi:hypothetical protein
VVEVDISQGLVDLILDVVFNTFDACVQLKVLLNCKVVIDGVGLGAHSHHILDLLLLSLSVVAEDANLP